MSEGKDVAVRNKVELTIWIVGFVLVSVCNYFLQMYYDGELPFKIGGNIVNIIVFVAGVIRSAMIFGVRISKGEIDMTNPPDIVKPKDKASK